MGNFDNQSFTPRRLSLLSHKRPQRSLSIIAEDSWTLNIPPFNGKIRDRSGTAGKYAYQDSLYMTEINP